MQALYGSIAALAVATLYYSWRAYFQTHRERMLRRRVAYMLWVIAAQIE